MVWTGYPLREMTLSSQRAWGVELGLWLGQVLGGGLPCVLGPWICHIYLTLFSQRHWKLGILPVNEWRLRGVNLLAQSYKVHNSQRLAWMEPRSDLLLNPCIFFFLPLLLVNFVLFHEPKCMLIPSPGVINLSCWLQGGLVLRVSLEKRLKVMGEIRACTKWWVSWEEEKGMTVIWGLAILPSDSVSPTLPCCVLE